MMKMYVTSLSVTRAWACLQDTGHCFWLAMYLLVLLFLSGCDSRGTTPTEMPDAPQVSENVIDDSGQQLLASGVTFTGQEGNSVRDRVYADKIIIAPRGFGAFNLNGVNEIMFENSHIESFPVNSATGQDEAPGSKSASGLYKQDFSNTLRDFVDTLPGDYGYISRIRMHPIHITLHGAGKNGSSVHVVADELLKEFKDDSQPELINVQIYDGESPNRLKVPKARWNTQTGQLILGSANQI